LNNPWDIVAEIEADNSRLAKEAIIKREAEAGNDDFFEGVRLACDCLITFGVRKVDVKREDANGTGLSFNAFKDLCGKLQRRELTGDAAKTAIAYAMMKATPAQWNGWYRRILIKDMRAGFSETIVNKIVTKLKLDKYAVPTFDCQLAHDGNGYESKMHGPKLVESKLDGVRVLTIVYPSGKVEQFSRNGKELVNFEVVKKQIAKHAIFFAEPVVLDGEIMSSTFQDLMKQVRRKSDVAADDSVLNLFDILTLREFQAGVGQYRQIDRSTTLMAWYTQFADHMPNVTVVGQELVDLDTDEGAARLAEINKAALAAGLEGIMIKDPTAVYECKRSTAWLKMKPWIEVSLKAVEVVEGEGKYAGMMGAIMFEGEDDGKFIRVSVGSGYSDKDRAAIWALRESVIGDIGEVRADALTLSQDSTDVYSLRFPRFQRWRGFEKGEKL
jgi:DNA ligase-1